MSDADHFASQDIEGTCQHNVVVFFYSIKDRFGCCALRYFKNSNCIGISAVQVKVQACACDGFSGGTGDLCVAGEDGRVCCDVVNGSAESVDIADRHCIWKPFLFVIMCKSCKIGIERSNWCLTVCHGFLCIAADYNKGKSRRCRYHLL